MEKFPGGGTKVVERGRSDTPKKKVDVRRKKRKKWCLCCVNIGGVSFSKQEEREVPVEEKEREILRKEDHGGLSSELRLERGWKTNCAIWEFPLSKREQFDFSAKIGNNFFW